MDKNIKKTLIKEELYGKNYKQIGKYPLNTSPYDSIKLFDNFDWAALGIAACGVVILIKIIVGSI